VGLSEGEFKSKEVQVKKKKHNNGEDNGKNLFDERDGGEG